MNKNSIEGVKAPSTQLFSIIKQAADNFIDFANNWKAIQTQGFQEGFTDKELQLFVRQELANRGLDKKQINNKIFYLEHREEEQERAKKNREKVVVMPSTEETESSFTNKSALDEIAQLRTENMDLNNKLLNVGFSDNPDVFCIRKDSETYFPKISVIEARSLLASFGDGTTKINIAWELATK